MITTMVGNYPKISPDARAPSLRTAITRYDEGRITLDELKRVEEEVTQEVIQDQIDAGLDMVTDGLIRWDDGQTYLARGISGYTINGLIRYFDTNTYYRHPIPAQRLESNGHISVKDYEFAVANSERPVKAVITGPYTMGRLSQLGCYEDLRSLVMDLASILNRELRALQEAGAPVIQLDEPSILRHKEDVDLFSEAIECAVDGITATKALYTLLRRRHRHTPPAVRPAGRPRRAGLRDGARQLRPRRRSAVGQDAGMRDSGRPQHQA